jgi:biotin carboxyl carrier protein
MNSAMRFGLLFLLVSSLAGCSGPKNGEAPRPRPVSVMELKETVPQRLDRISGTVASWKTEKIGFEVDGRVEYVIEPDTDIDPRSQPLEGKRIRKPTLLATLVKTQYQIRVKGALAQLETNQRKKEAADIEANKVVPAEIAAAKAEEKRAKDEYVRIKRAFDQKAVTESDLNAAAAKRDEGIARVEQLQAKKKAKLAEVTSLIAQIQLAEQSLEEARRNLRDCELFSPFRGRVSAVHVIPGGYVKRGEPVLTVQMMVPIKVEFEVSAETDRRISYEDMIPVFVTDNKGQERQILGSVYQKSTTADPTTRTYSITLLLQNEILSTPVPASLNGKTVARTKKLWALQFPAPDHPGHFAIDSKAVHRDKNGYYVWKITNRTLQTSSLETNPVLSVEKLRVDAVDYRVSLLGLFTLTAIKIKSGSKFRKETDLIAGELFPQKVAKAFDGDTVLLDRSRWMLRPGDVVSVDVSGRPERRGFYVPINTIRDQAGAKSIFVVEPVDGGGQIARKIDVRTFPGPGTLMGVAPLGKQKLKAGMQLIVEGVHFLTDGEAVAVSKRVEVRR